MAGNSLIFFTIYPIPTILKVVVQAINQVKNLPNLVKTICIREEQVSIAGNVNVSNKTELSNWVRQLDHLSQPC